MAEVELAHAPHFAPGDDRPALSSVDDGERPWRGVALDDDANATEANAYAPYFQRALASTPVVERVAPSAGFAGATVAVCGSGFSPNASENGVAIGGVECAVVGANATCVARTRRLTRARSRGRR